MGETPCAFRHSRGDSGIEIELHTSSCRRPPVEKIIQSPGLKRAFGFLNVERANQFGVVDNWFVKCKHGIVKIVEVAVSDAPIFAIFHKRLPFAPADISKFVEIIRPQEKRV